jgi:hypothetical protein
VSGSVTRQLRFSISLSTWVKLELKKKKYTLSCKNMNTRIFLEFVCFHIIFLMLSVNMKCLPTRFWILLRIGPFKYRRPVLRKVWWGIFPFSMGRFPFHCDFIKAQREFFMVGALTSRFSQSSICIFNFFCLIR